MLLIRDIMYCKPGKVRPMVEKFLAMSKLTEKRGLGRMRVLTDLSAERYWTVVSEMEVPSLEAFTAMQGSDAMQEFGEMGSGVLSEGQFTAEGAVSSSDRPASGSTRR